jgi:hypothetical protein
MSTMDVKKVFKIFSCILNLKLGGVKDTFGQMKLMRNEEGKLFGTRMDVMCITLNLGHVFIASFLQCWKLGSKFSKASTSFNDEVEYVTRLGQACVHFSLCEYLIQMFNK